MRVLSLFSGIGGLELGLERAGFELVGQVERDPFCLRVLAHHWPDVPRWGDIQELDLGELPRADLVCGGFPCQPVSQIGKRKGREDERWLWPDFYRVLRALRPSYVLVENTAGLLARGMGEVLGDLAALGYDAEWQVLPAGAFGARHKRDRTFLVAYPSGERLEARDGAPTEGRREQVFRAPPPIEGVVRWNVTEPAVLESVDGVPDRVARCRAAGNAVVPAVAEWIGHQILEHAKGA